MNAASSSSGSSRSAEQLNDGNIGSSSASHVAGSAVAPGQLAPPIGHSTPSPDGHLRHTVADAIHTGSDMPAVQTGIGAEDVTGIGQTQGETAGVQDDAAQDTPGQHAGGVDRHRRHQPHGPPQRSSSLAVRRRTTGSGARVERKDEPSGQLEQAVSRPDRRSRRDEDPDAHALLNLPPPLPFNLKVDNLWVGVPARSKALS